MNESRNTYFSQIKYINKILFNFKSHKCIVYMNAIFLYICMYIYKDNHLLSMDSTDSSVSTVATDDGRGTSSTLLRVSLLLCWYRQFRRIVVDVGGGGRQSLQSCCCCSANCSNFWAIFCTWVSRRLCGHSSDSCAYFQWANFNFPHRYTTTRMQFSNQQN